MSIVITVANVLPPGQGKKQASIIDDTGKRWGIAVTEMGNFRQFGSYEILRFKENVFQGKTYYTIEQSVPVTGNPNVSPPPSPMQSAVNSGSYVNTNDQLRMDIFVCGAFNHMMSNPSINPMDITGETLVFTVERLKAVWKKTLGPQPDPISSTKARGGSDRELDDHIPF